ncbi:MAG: UDP-2,3-diacylglucosamine diphosphatase [Bacteroidales bacterium]|nr:UDP-2,3-diacylglucosamine diphosphatase [Bacteroidales bacterium]
MTRDKIYFLSDFHLGLGTWEEERAKEDKILRFLNLIEKDAERIVLLGDIFDFWWEYKQVVPKGFVRFQAKIADLTSKGITVDYFIGNHDLWQKNYFSKELGVNIYRRKYQEFVFNGKTFVIGHGDGLDSKDYGYKIMDAIFSCRRLWWLFTSLPTSFSFGFAKLWSRKNRSRHRKYDTHDMKDKEPMYLFCKEFIKNRHADYFIFGHRHIKNVFYLDNGAKYINTGSWIDDSPYVVWDSKELQLKSFESQ